eukprot:3694341-Rhodomonas_salina.6
MVGGTEVGYGGSRRWAVCATEVEYGGTRRAQQRAFAVPFRALTIPDSDMAWRVFFLWARTSTCDFGTDAGRGFGAPGVQAALESGDAAQLFDLHLPALRPLSLLAHPP